MKIGTRYEVWGMALTVDRSRFAILRDFREKTETGTRVILRGALTGDYFPNTKKGEQAALRFVAEQNEATAKRLLTHETNMAQANG